MTISEMHIWFRQYAQQMGLQNVRAILPEQIDLLINTSISDIVNQIIKENIGITNDRVVTDNSKVGQINALKTLYKVSNLPILSRESTMAGGDVSTPVMSSSNFVFKEKNAAIGKLTTEDAIQKFPDYLFIVDFSINYKQTSTGLYKSGSHFVVKDEDSKIETALFPVRLIDDVYLADSLNDFILKPRIRTPIIVTYNNGTFDLYIEHFEKRDNGSYILQNNLVPYELRFSYISKPAIVAYKEDLTGDPADNVNCDLPEHLHVDILKHAVDLWRIAVSGDLHAAQQQEKAAQQENMRNNYRNEGNNRQ